VRGEGDGFFSPRILAKKREYEGRVCCRELLRTQGEVGEKSTGVQKKGKEKARKKILGNLYIHLTQGGTTRGEV